MEQFKIDKIMKCSYTHRSDKFNSMMKSFKHILGADYINSEELIYIKNYYNYFNHQCKIEDIKIYSVIKNRLYCISYSNEFNGPCLDAYSLNEIKYTQLKENKAYGSLHLDLSIHFKDGLTLNLNNFKDTYDDIGVDELAEIMLNMYYKLNNNC
ncbi:MAG: hypothetical protein ACRDD7_14915 [Peptostreptococcaceae bacterium]